jgi:apolipoprotein N-acyltransferase
LKGDSEILNRVNSNFHSNRVVRSRNRRVIRWGVRVIAFLGLTLVASWRPEDRLIPIVFAIFGLAVLDRRGLTVAAAAGLVTILYHWEPAAILLGVFGYTLFFYTLIGLRPKRAALLGFGFGAGMVILNLRWLVAEFDAHWAGLVLFIVSLYGGLVMATVAALLRSPLVRRPGLVGLILSILAFPALDYLRIAVPRFGTSNLYSAHLVAANPDLAQAAHWFGAGGLSALLAFCSYAAAEWLARERPTQWQPRIAARRAARQRIGIAVLLVILVAGIGELDRSRLGSYPNSTLKIAVVQSGLSPEVGSSQELPSLPRDTENYATSLRSYLGSFHPCDIIFLPEGAISIGDWNDPDDPNAEPLMRLSDLKQKFGAAIKSVLVTGAMIREQLDNQLAFRNTAISLDSHLKVLGQVDKQFGAPLVEVNPFRGIPILERIGQRATHLSRQMMPERNSAILPVTTGLSAAVAICNEHQLPDIWSRRGIGNLSAVNFQLVLSDVSWFDNSEEERDQSRLARRLLAAKYRLPLLYVASSGSELWNSDGKLVQALAAHTRFGIWELSVPKLDATRKAWQPPSELWPLLLFCALFAWRLYRSKLVARTASRARPRAR